MHKTRRNILTQGLAMGAAALALTMATAVSSKEKSSSAGSASKPPSNKKAKPDFYSTEHGTKGGATGASMTVNGRYHH
jgi:hypothetical protein